MRIGQNGPLDKFTRFLFMRLNVPCIAMYGAIKNLCDRRLTRIIRINKTPAEKCTFTGPVLLYNAFDIMPCYNTRLHCILQYLALMGYSYSLYTANLVHDKIIIIMNQYTLGSPTYTLYAHTYYYSY
jgi:hypothetical protein